MEKSSTEDPPCLTGAWEAGSLVPSRSEMRARRRATCFSCSSSWRRCSSTFSWAMRCGRCVIELDLTRRRAGAYKVGEGVAVLFAADGVHRLGVVHWRGERGVDGTMIGVGPVPSVPCVSGASCSFLYHNTPQHFHCPRERPSFRSNDVRAAFALGIQTRSRFN